MRKYLLLFISAICVASCHGQSDQQYNQMPDEFVGPYTLVTDKSTIESNGRDAVTFTLNDSYGRDILLETDKLVAPVKIYNTVTKKIIELGTREFVSIEDGDYEFEASYLGETSSNKVTVTSVNRTKYEVYYKRVALFKATSVNCPACPALGKNLHNLDADISAHTVQVSCHGNYGTTDPFSVYVGTKDLASWLMGQFGINSWPTLVYDMNMAFAGSSMTSMIEKNIFKCLVENPATCGIKMISSEYADEQIKVTASLKSSLGAEYDLGFLVICDGLVYQGGNSVNDDGVYDDVLITASQNFAAFSTESIKQVANGSEQQFVVYAPIASKTYESFKDKLEIVLVAHRRTSDGNSIIDNSILTKFGADSEYILN